MQHHTFDRLGLPYVWDVCLGAILAKPSDGVGDGLWAFELTEKNELVIGHSNDPRRGERMRAIDESHVAEARRAIADWRVCWEAKRAEREALSLEEEKDDAAGCKRHKEPRVRHARQVPGADAELIEMCTVDKRMRPDGVRSDMTISTPDGHKFRSIVAALRHMRGD